MVSLALMDEILNIDPKAKQVTVQAGARVQEVVEALRPYNLTLQNYASIREQSIGGFTQVLYLLLKQGLHLLLVVSATTDRLCYAILKSVWIANGRQWHYRWQ